MREAFDNWMDNLCPGNMLIRINDVMREIERVVTLATVISDECDSQSLGSSQNGFWKKL